MRGGAVLDDAAEALARSARSIRDVLFAALGAGVAPPQVRELRDAVESALGRRIDDAACADVVAQMLVNAIFAARAAHDRCVLFDAGSALARLPCHDELLRRLRAVVELPGDRDEPFGAAVAELCDAVAGMDVVDTIPGDPLLHFYERFLAAYDPGVRGLRGVYVTPQPVVRYIVRSVLEVLDDAFGVAADEPDGELELLDPACGTGTFLHEVVAEIRARFIARGDPDGWRAFVRTVLLRRLAGIEVLPVPYVVAHLNLALTLSGADLDEPASAAFGYELGRNDRVRISLANALEPRCGGGDAGGGSSADSGVVVVFGNPPYSGHSANANGGSSANGRAGQAAIGQLRGYFAGVDEANKKWLHDDYVKFIRFAEDRVERAGRGVVAFVTSHAYLDNPTFAGMRRHLMRTFDEIYVLDLHGNAKIVETAPDGSRDQNVFDIQQGVAIGIFIKRHAERTGGCVVRFAELYGERQAKYDRLSVSTIRSTPWTTVAADAAAAASFRPMRTRAPLGYAGAPSLASAMPVSSLGVLTKRDAFAVAFTPRALLDRLASFADPQRTDEETAAAFGLPPRDNDRWSIATARRIAANADPARVRAIQYRCGDFRWYYDADGIVARRNRRVLDHVVGAERFAFLVGRQGGAATSGTWDSVWATATSSDQNLFRRGGATVFPLVLRAAPDSAGPPRWNFSGEFLEYVAARAGENDRAALPERAAGYIYGLLNAPRFRAEFQVELRRDFPRIPVAGAASFRVLSDVGWQLLRLHVLAEVVPSVIFAPVGENVVESIAFGDADAAGYGSVVINAAGQRFERVHRRAWERTCGGSPVLERFLRSRKGRRLDEDDIRAFAVLATALDRERPLLDEADEIVAALLDERSRGDGMEMQ